MHKIKNFIVEKLSANEIIPFLNLFNRGGYVLDFSTDNFDLFTEDSVGVALCATYNLSKGKSLETYVKETSSENVTKLLNDLLV